MLVRVDFNVPLHIGVRGPGHGGRRLPHHRRAADAAPAARRGRRGRRRRSHLGRPVGRAGPALGDGPGARAARGAVPGRRADREPALRPGREGERPRLRAAADRGVRRLRRRGLRRGAPQRTPRSSGRRSSCRARPGCASPARSRCWAGCSCAPGPPLRGRGRRRQGGGQARGAQGPGHQGGHAHRRRRHGLHLPGGAGHARRATRCSTRRTWTTAASCWRRVRASCCRPTRGRSSRARPSARRARASGRGGASR